jgi:type III secretion protein W
MEKIHGVGSIMAQISANRATSARRSMETRHAQLEGSKHAIASKAAKIPAGAKNAWKSLEHLKSQRSEQKRTSQLEKEQKEMRNTVTGRMQSSADSFNQRNSELGKYNLLALLGSLKDTDTYEDILQKVLDMYPDYTLADEALDFLLETTHGALRNTIMQAKDELNARYHREIIAGRNIATQAREFSEEGLGSPTALRDIYRDITGNPRQVHELFDEFAKMFDYDKMKIASRFLFHSLGADLKAKGPSISRAELSRLIEDTRSLQAILGVYLFFRERMKLIYAQYTNLELEYPESITFEVLADKFMQLIKERYISSDQIRQIAKQLGISDEVLAQIIIFTQMRDAVRGVSPRLYRDIRHKEEALEALIDALEKLEDAADKEEDLE